MSAAGPLASAQVEEYHANGFVLVPGFYDVASDIEPVQHGIHEIIRLVADTHHVELGLREPGAAGFDDGYLQLKVHDRRLAGVVYDAVKQLAPFVRLTASVRNEAAFRQLRRNGVVGIAGNGSGIRIDNPDETQFATWWHQEYPAQLRSTDGVVFWSPLRAVTPELGPVELCVGSHRDGLRSVFVDDGDGVRRDAYALRLVDEYAVVSPYRTVAPLCAPGDLLLVDFLTIHRSGANTTDVPRWTMQLRYFGFEDDAGRSIDWSGSFASGRSVSDVHPGLVVERDRDG